MNDSEHRIVPAEAFENALRETGVAAGSDFTAQQAADQQRLNIAHFTIGQTAQTEGLASKPELIPEPNEDLPADVLAVFGITERPQGKYDLTGEALRVMEGTWRTVGMLLQDGDTAMGVMLADWANVTKRPSTPILKLRAFTAYAQTKAAQALESQWAHLPASEQAAARHKYVWQNRRAFAPLLEEANPNDSSSKKPRQAAAVICSGDTAQILDWDRTLREKADYRDYGKDPNSHSDVLLTAFVVDETLCQQAPLAALAGTIVQPWKALEPKTHTSVAFLDYSFPLDELITNAFMTAADAKAEAVRREVPLLWAELPPADKHALINSLDIAGFIKLPPSALIDYVAGNLAEASLPANEVRSFLASLRENVTKHSPTLSRKMTELIYGQEFDAAEAGLTRHASQGPRIMASLAERLSSCEAAPTQPADAYVQVDVTIDGAIIQVTHEAEGPNRLYFRVSHNEEGREEVPDWAGRDFESYDAIREYLKSLKAISTRFELNKYNEEYIVKNSFRQQSERLGEALGRLEQFDVTGLSAETSEYRIQVASNIGYRRSEADRFIASLRDPALMVYWQLAKHLHAHGYAELQETAIAVKIPYLGHMHLGVSAEHPYALLEKLGQLEPEMVLDHIRRIGEDVNFTEITLGTNYTMSDGLKSQEGVYDALELMRQRGYDAILGESMATAFSGTAAKIYIEQALPALNYPIEQNPMATLLTWQKRLAEQATNLGYTGDASQFVTRQLPMTLEKEQEVLAFFKNSQPQETLVNNWTIEQYAAARVVIEQFFNFAVQNSIPGYERYRQLPSLIEEELRSSMRGGRMVISEKAKAHFAEKAIDWGAFLFELPEDMSAIPDISESYAAMKSLGKQLANELADMSQGDIIARARQIIHGEVAAVGKDIAEPRAIQTWNDYYAAVRELLATPKIHLVMTKAGRLGWTITTSGEHA
jgi:hypothetical protein